MAWEWDPFDVAGDLTGTKLWLLTIFCFIFSFISIRIPSIFPNIDMGYIHVQIKNFSPCLLTCFLASLFSPQALFWYVYPTILLLFLCSTCISNMFRSFVFWVRDVLSTFPNVNIFIIANDDAIEAINRELHEEVEGVNLEEVVVEQG